MLASVLSVLALAAAPSEPAKAAAPKPPTTLSFEPKTKTDGETLQVILGQRALFRLDDRSAPVLEKVEEGKLAAAHPAGQAQESFQPPPAGQLAAALDASAEKRVSVLKIWNSLAQPMDYRALALVLRGDKLTPVAVKVCAVPAGGVRTESWPAPVVAVGLSRFKPAAGADPACDKGG